MTTIIRLSIGLVARIESDEPDRSPSPQKPVHVVASCGCPSCVLTRATQGVPQPSLYS